MKSCLPLRVRCRGVAGVSLCIAMRVRLVGRGRVAVGGRRVAGVSPILGGLRRRLLGGLGGRSAGIARRMG